MRAKTQFELRKMQRERINTYKLIGIDLGDEYSLYENNEEVKAKA